MRTCNKCNVEWDISEYRRGWGYVCKKCESARSQAWREANRNKDRAYEAARPVSLAPAWKKHRLTEKRYSELLSSQSGRCKICSEVMGKVCIDHDHSCCSGKHSCGQCMRGLLCPGCNWLLGMARNNIETLSSAINYLENYTKI